MFDGLIGDHLDKCDTSTLYFRNLPVQKLSDQVFLLLLAGTDTTASALTTVFYHLAKEPSYQQKLVEAIQEIGDVSDPIFDYTAALRIPLLV